MSTKKTYIIFTLLVALGLAACKNGVQKGVPQKVKSDGQKLTEAYQKQDWKTIVAIGDTLVGDSDKMNLSIPYAEALAAVGNPQKAIEVLNRKLSSNPDDYYLYQTKGNVFYSMERFDSALINYEIVIAMRPTYARPYINEGAIYELLGDKENAIANYLVAAKLFAENNYFQETMEYAKRVLTLDSTNVEAKELLNIICE